MRGEKLQRQIRYQKRHHRKWMRRLTKHHNQPKSLGGKSDHWNLYELSAEHHAAWHKLFGLRTFEQAAQVLLRMQAIHQASGGV
jgi:hypothetical protein